MTVLSMTAVWRRILVPIQFSRRLPGAELELARAIARTHHAKILLLHVVPLSHAVAADASLARSTTWKRRKTRS